MLRQQSFASVVMSLPMLRALSQCLASTATGARSACSALGQLSAGPQWSSACSLLQQSPSISVESSQACRHVRFDGAWGSACTRAWSSQTTTASPSQTSNPEPTPNISQPAQPSPSAPSTAEPTPQPTAAGVEASEGTPQSAAGAATAAAAAQPVAPAAQQKKETIQAIRARVFGEPILPGERTGRRVLARKLKGAELASWYFIPPFVPGLHNEAKEYIALRKLNKRQKKKADEAADGGAKKKKK